MKKIIYIFTLFSCFESASQNIEIPNKNYSVKNNFLSDNIYCIFRDSKGLLWFGTDAGVLQYDGSNFRLLTTREGMPDNEIFNFCEDYFGRIWFATFNGNMGYYYQGKLYNEDNSENLKIKNHPTFIYYIGIQADSSILFFYFNSDKISEYKNDRFKTNTLNIGRKKNEYIHAISRTNEDEYCIFTNECRTYLKNGRIMNRDTFHKSNFYAYNKNIFERRVDSLFVIHQCNDQFIAKLDNNIIVPYTFFLEDSTHLFAGTVQGLYEINPLQNPFQFNKYLKDCKVSSINKDIEGNYWIGTLNKGAYFIPKNYRKISYYKLDTINKIINFSILNNDIILMSDDQKLYKLSNNGTLSLYLDFRNKNEPIIGNTKYYSAIYKNNIVLGGSYNAFINLEKPNTMNSWNASSRFYWRDLNLYKDTIYGHTNYSIAQATIQQNSDLPSKLKISHEVRYFIPEDHQRIFDISLYNNQLWVSTSSNFYYFDGHKLIQSPLNKYKSFKKFNFYRDILVGISHDNKIYCGKLSPSKQFQLKEFDPECIWIDMNYIFENKVLLRSDKGYYILDFSNDQFKLSPTENVILPNSPIEIVCDSPYVYFLSTENEITKIKYSDIQSTPIPPILNIISVSINGIQSDYTRNIEILENNCENFTIDFTGIGFNRKKINYQYSMDGENWTNLDVPKLILIHPESGNYKIRLRCRSDSSPYGQVSLVNLVVLPPWYRSIWFIIFSLAFFFLLTRYIVRFIIRKNLEIKEQKHAEELKFQHAEFKALNALMNPHFVFNSLNNIQYLINKGDKKSANEFLNTFSLLIRQNIENIKQELISLDKELNLVEYYLQIEKLRFQDRLQFVFNIQEDIELDTIMIPPLLIQPLVENAIKHGIFQNPSEIGQIWITVAEIQNQLLIRVLNTHGENSRELSHNGLNQSLENIQSRLKKLEFVHLKKYCLVINPESTFENRKCFESRIIIDL